MKPFDLQKALAGDPVVTRDGRPVTQVTYFEVRDVNGDRIFGVVGGTVESWGEHGHYNVLDEHDLDLFMAPKVKEGWINIYQTITGEWRTYSPIYDTEQEAVDQDGDVAPTRIEWEVP